eukprot:TRINITY_DN19002_c0_g1_i1.p1 TRINITY_DN19002_c0_g1~~TRINITY_DN19002_c0_g1_i1.p1  ORF type:complete len:627 (+),score=93.87 TRINITY_DN19002_c0_g1_i1:135-2015(+)
MSCSEVTEEFLDECCMALREALQNVELTDESQVYQFIKNWGSEQETTLQRQHKAALSEVATIHSEYDIKVLVDYSKGVFGRIKNATFGINQKPILIEEVTTSIPSMEINQLLRDVQKPLSDKVIKLLGYCNIHNKWHIVYEYPGYFPVMSWITAAPSKGVTITIDTCKTFLLDVTSAISALGPRSVSVPFSAWNVLLASDTATKFVLCDVGLCGNGSAEQCIQSLLRVLMVIMTYGSDELHCVPHSYWKAVAEGYFQSEQEALSSSVDDSFRELVPFERMQSTSEDMNHIEGFINRVDAVQGLEMRHAFVDSSRFGELAVPFPGCPLSFLQYNVPMVERIISGRLLTGNQTINMSEILSLTQSHTRLSAKGSDHDTLHLSFVYVCDAIRSTAPSKVTINGSSGSSALFYEQEEHSAAAIINQGMYVVDGNYLIVGPACVELLNLSSVSNILNPLLEGNDIIRELRVTHCVGTVVQITGILSQLSSLCLSEAALTDDCGLRLIEAYDCGFLPNVKLLDLSGNLLTEVFGVAFSNKVLQSDTCLLEELILSRNKLKDATAFAIAKSLTVNVSLRSLNLQRNLLTVSAVEEIISVLECRPHLNWYDTEGIFSFSMKQQFRDKFNDQLLG